ncbi:tetratricopeptide repeat protein [Arcobacteraceae bacterium]|nr:tetratricopeptide repeat protein [Arcobacteraceae bacterium]
MSDLKAKEITQDQLIRVLKASKESSSSLRFGFILGAGASINSKIPSGSFFAKKWHKEISEDLSEKLLKEWEKTIPDFDKDNLAQSYTKIFAKRFEVDYQAGYEELQREMDNAEPSIGYSFLAQVLDETPNKFIITTNFDTMVEDALFGLKKSKPLVLGHELLSKYINPVSPSRPTIVKIHRDFLFDPYNDDKHIKELDKQWEESLTPVLNENAMIVIGYGGNDDSLMNYLKEIKNRKPIYWCYRGDKNNLSSKIKDVLTEKDFIIQIKGFDKLMLTINDKLGFENIIDVDNISNSPIVKNALDYANKYEKQLEDLTKEVLDKEEQTAIKKLLPHWWEYQLLVNEEKDDNKKEKIYKDGLKVLSNSHELMGNYANLLQKLNRDDEAEIYYKKALELDPDNVNNNGNYANLLQILNRDNESETYYKKALELDPNRANNNGNYASLLDKLNKDNEAEIYYKKALELDPDNTNNNGNYANLLRKLNRDNESETYYKKALKINPNNPHLNGNYTQFLLIQSKKDETEQYIEKAFSNITNDNDLLIELWFYRFAHYSEYFEKAKKELNNLLKNSYKSIGWDFSRNIAQAKKEGHPDIKLLEEYADKITKI